MLTIFELIEHYNFYVDNCTNDEIPIILLEWHNEYKEDMYIILRGSLNNEY